jgi:hypothetical protein
MIAEHLQEWDTMTFAVGVVMKFHIVMSMTADSVISGFLVA